MLNGCLCFLAMTLPFLCYFFLKSLNKAYGEVMGEPLIRPKTRPLSTRYLTKENSGITTPNRRKLKFNLFCVVWITPPTLRYFLPPPNPKKSPNTQILGPSAKNSFQASGLVCVHWLAQAPPRYCRPVAFGASPSGHSGLIRVCVTAESSDQLC